MKMNVSWSSHLKPILIFSCILLLTSCQNKQEKASEDTSTQPESVYEDWNRYQYQNFVFRYPQGHVVSDSINDYAKRYEVMLQRDAQILQMTIPADTITIYFYTGMGQAQQIVKTDFPYVSGDSIHFWGHIHFGAPLMEYVIEKWSPVDSRHYFIKNGLIALMDASGRNNHKMTSEFIKNGDFIPLQSFASDTNTTVWWGWDKAIESASFVDFIIYKYGAETLKIMYESPVSFDSTVNGMFEISVDSLEKEWLEIVNKIVSNE